MACFARDEPRKAEQGKNTAPCLPDSLVATEAPSRICQGNETELGCSSPLNEIYNEIEGDPALLAG